MQRPEAVSRLWWDCRESFIALSPSKEELLKVVTKSVG